MPTILSPGIAYVNRLKGAGYINVRTVVGDMPSGIDRAASNEEERRTGFGFRFGMVRKCSYPRLNIGKIATSGLSRSSPYQGEHNLSSTNGTAPQLLRLLRK